MQKYTVIVLMNISRINMSDRIITNSICIIFWSNICMVSIKEEIIQNPPFQFSGPVLVILIVSTNMYFGDTSEV